MLSLLPPAFRKTVAQALNAETSRVEEIRCRLGQPVSVVECGKVRLLPTDSISQEHLDGLFERAVNVSAHAHSEEIQNGFLFTDTGYRVGLCGTAYISRDGKTGIRELTSVSIRIPREIPGADRKRISKYFDPLTARLWENNASAGTDSKAIAIRAARCGCR